MLKKIILVIFVSVMSLCASQDVEVKYEKESALSTFLSHKEMKIINDVFMTLDLSSALAIVDDRFLIDTLENAPKRTNPDKSVVTLSFKF